MKKIAVLSCITLLFIGCTSSTKNLTNDLFKENLKGNIRSIEINKYLGKETIIDNKKVILYNSFGNKIDEKYFDKNLELYRTVAYRYNKNNKLEEEVSTSDFMGVLSELKYKFQVFDNKTVELCYNSNNELKGKQIYKYNNKGIITEQLSYDAANDLSSRSVFSYNQNLKPFQWLMYDKDEILRIKTTQEFNGNGDEILEEFHGIGDNPTVVYRFEYEYDSQDNWISKKRLIGDSIIISNRRNITYIK